MVDYDVLEGIPTFNEEGDVRYIAPCMGLFFVRNNGDLVPIAIQLHQKPNDSNPITTPSTTGSMRSFGFAPLTHSIIRLDFNHTHSDHCQERFELLILDW